MSEPSDVRVVHEPEQHRYAAYLDGALAGFTVYELGEEPDAPVVFVHTEVDDAFGGRGVGSAIARGALDDVRATGRGVVPQCPFIRSWIDKHPAYADLVVG